MLNFIANIKSGKGRGRKNVDTILKYCLTNNIPYSLHITNSPGHATEIAKVLTEDGRDIIAIGGDGTFHEVLNGISDPSKTALGFIPSGRGNDFARAAGLSLDPLKALNDIIKGETDYFDYINIGKLRCLNVAGTGLDIDVLERVDGKPGKLTYLTSLLYCLKHFDPYHVKVKVNGAEHEYDCIMVGVCNGTCIGGNLKLSPHSLINDGKLNVVAITMPEDNKLMKIVPKFQAGKHIDMPITHEFWCDEVTIETQKPIQLDGEIYRNISFDCKIAASGLKTYKINK